MPQLRRRRRAGGRRQRVLGRPPRGSCDAPARVRRPRATTSASRAAATPARRRRSAPLLLFLNPDASPAPGCLDALRAAARAAGWGAWQALVTLPGGERINTRGGVVHCLGFGWAGGLRRAASAGARRAGRGRLRVRRGAGRAAGGVGRGRRLRRRATSCTARTSTSRCGCGSRAGASASCRRRACRARLRVREGRLQVVPTSSATAGGRCSATTRRRCSRCSLPALLASELALLAVAARGGWLGAKLRAQRRGAADAADGAAAAARGPAGRAGSRRAFVAGAERLARLAVPAADRAAAGAAGRATGGSCGGARWLTRCASASSAASRPRWAAAAWRSRWSGPRRRSRRAGTPSCAPRAPRPARRGTSRTRSGPRATSSTCSTTGRAGARRWCSRR